MLHFSPSSQSSQFHFIYHRQRYLKRVQREAVALLLDSEIKDDSPDLP